MTEPERRIAKITDTFLGFEDHGIFTCTLTLDYGGSQQGAGTYDLRGAGGSDFIMRLLAACGVSTWEKLVGRTVYAYSTPGKVTGIEPLPTEPGTSFHFADWSDAQ